MLGLQTATRQHAWFHSDNRLKSTKLAAAAHPSSSMHAYAHGDRVASAVGPSHWLESSSSVMIKEVERVRTAAECRRRRSR